MALWGWLLKAIAAAAVAAALFVPAAPANAAPTMSTAAASLNGEWPERYPVTQREPVYLIPSYVTARSFVTKTAGGTTASAGVPE
jgi:hypothetical protein